MRKLAFWLTIGFIFTVPWEAAIHISAIGRVSRAFGLIAAAVWALSVVLRGRLRKPDAFVKAYFLFLVWNGLSLYWSIDAGSTLDGFLTYTQVFGMILILWDLFETEQQIEWGLQAFVLGAYVSAMSVIVNFLTAPPTKFPEHQRIKALGFEVDGVALVIALAIPAAWYLATGPTLRRRFPALQAINFVYVPAALFAIILTGTRGAALASIPTIVFIMWTLRNASRARRILAWAMVVVAVVAVISFAPREPLERITGSVVDVTGGDSLSGRRGIWEEALMTFFDNPITGVGLDSQRAASSVGKEAHNTALSVVVETGIVGVLLFGNVILIVVRRAWQRVGWSAWYWRTQVIVVGLGALSLSLEDTKSVWIFLTLCVASAAAVRTRRTQPDFDAQPQPAPMPVTLPEAAPGTDAG